MPQIGGELPCVEAAGIIRRRHSGGKIGTRAIGVRAVARRLPQCRCTCGGPFRPFSEVRADTLAQHGARGGEK